MRRSILLLHGFTGTSESYFLPSLKDRFAEHNVVALDFPKAAEPHIDSWTDHLLSQPTKDFDLIVAHSLGGTFALSLLSRKLITARSLLMIGSSPGPKDNVHMNTFLTYPLDFEIVKKTVKNIVTVQSFDDPWTLPEYGIINVKHSGGYGLFYGDKGHFETKTLPEEILATLDRLLGDSPSS